MKNISFLIKPSSSKCNLNCSYCFYYDEAQNRSIEDYGYMSDETTYKLIEQAFLYAKDGNISFAFQGGEPTLIGLDYYRKFIACVNSMKDNESVNYSIQTNGLLIDEEWSIFFQENNFLVGLSLDGTKKTNDTNRVDYTKKGSYFQIIAAAKILKKFEVSFNILTVVTNVVAKNTESVYNSYKELGFDYLQFILCLEPLDNTIDNHSLSPEMYFSFLKKLFDLWYQDFMEDNYISIRMFDNIGGMYLGRQPESCDMIGQCTVQHVIEADGSIYPCDFYALDEYLLGNIMSDSLINLENHPIATKFIDESIGVHEKCTQCKWLRLCRGGCKKHNDVKGLNKYCDTYLEFYEFAHDRFMEIASKISGR